MFSNDTLRNTTVTPPPSDYSTAPPNNCSAGINNTAENVILAILLALIFSCSMLGNTIVISLIWFSRELRKRTTMFFILSLAISDMLRALVMIPTQISMRLHSRGVHLFPFCHSKAVCILFNVGDTTGNVASILTLFFIAVERYVAIRHPFKYTTLFSKSNAFKMIAAIWSFSVIWAILGIISWTSSDSAPVLSVVFEPGKCENGNSYFFFASYLGIYIIPLTIMTFTYSIILKIALSQIKAIASTQVQPAANNNSSDQSPSEKNQMILSSGSEGNVASPRTQQKKQKENLFKRRELKATKSVAIVYFTFLICFLPSAIIAIALAFNPDFMKPLSEENKAAFKFIMIGLTQTLMMSNTMLNPIIYSFSNGQFRNAFRAMYAKLLKTKDFRNESSYYVTNTS